MRGQALAVATLASWPSASDVLGRIDGRTALLLLVPGAVIAICLAVWLARGPAELRDLRTTGRRSAHDPASTHRRCGHGGDGHSGDGERDGADRDSAPGFER